MMHSQNIATEKEIFLREQIISLYMFAAKTTITLASATLGFSVGLQGLLDRHNHYDCVLLLIAGWGFLILSIIITICSIKAGLNTLYLFFNNLLEQKPEFDATTIKKERETGTQILNGFISYIFGIIFILIFLYMNFLN